MTHCGHGTPLGGVCVECDHMRRVALGLADDEPLPDRCPHGRASVHCWKCQSDSDRELREAWGLLRRFRARSDEELRRESWLEMVSAAWRGGE